ncbi:hypothetical protein [Paraglaciecola marina]|uniref:hypothetical protein n=1 Tax=Paraglaciecola marina TaxID=2500157 RepID=UPI00105D3BDA|nr:hypothetical protein [Paraglaciecola marina]
MLHFKKIQWLKVIAYAIVPSISVVLVVAILTFGLLSLGFDITENATIFLLASYLCSFAITYFAYFTLAKKQFYHPFQHAVFVYILNIAIGFTVDFLLPIALITWEVFIVELFAYIAILVVATKHGIKYRNRFIDNAV